MPLQVGLAPPAKLSTEELEREITELLNDAERGRVWEEERAKEAAVAAEQREKKAVASAVEKTREQCKKQAGT